ncbi:MAG: tRNA (adenosine(37)-N6)-threonylcarbamoyltransferase complex transferase subunit TsaD [Rhodospirillales bacterium]|nr:tRNA (adenosine(37)-N6)-threonylcarbamoyltransferase complex transferase subunit TsaD [Alphaproteobacteria bacterium]MCB9981374.1 tRNA (adenosine(37)-N6)-threonylcarbamoyltransferase complex transferase subunit TsaD [Rhodospirillales bacterium]
MYILGIETSCDETAAAIVNEKGDILANIVLSQLKEHLAFGGVVPEIAARAHIDHLHTLIKAAMDDAGLSFKDIDGVAATCGPGLIGGVMVGMIAGKAIAASQNLPFIAVNHLEGHALTPRLTDQIEFPYLLLLVSGGHTQILVAEDVGTYKLWGTTLDDAAGECFDKSAKLMGLPYPGGPEIQKIAGECEDPAAALKRFALPSPMKGRKTLDFSFSGLKTAVRLAVEALPEGDLQRTDIADLACAFQTTVADVIADRCKRAIDRFKTEYNSAAPALVVSGGVAANTAIRQRLELLCENHAMRAYAPPVSLCGDNAAMIAWAGLERLQKGLTDNLDFKARPRWPLNDMGNNNAA